VALIGGTDTWLRVIRRVTRCPALANCSMMAAQNAGRSAGERLVVN
jgi:hypothetical protein